MLFHHRDKNILFSDTKPVMVSIKCQSWIICIKNFVDKHIRNGGISSVSGLCPILKTFDQCDQIRRNFATLAKFWRLWQFVKGLFSILPFFLHNLAISYAHWLIFIIVNGQISKCDLVIWSHCFWCCRATRSLSLSVFFTIGKHNWVWL